MATEKKQYIYRLMKAKCSCSATDFAQYLNLPEDHGVAFHDSEYPLMNANDHVAGEHINTFGRCKSLKNPGGQGANLIMPFFGPLLLKATVGCKCDPMTLVPWIGVDEDYFIDGAPALTLESELPCYYGGVISIVAELEKEGTDEGQQKEEEESRDVDARELLPSEVKEKIESFCNDESKNEQVLTQEQQEAEETRSNFHAVVDEIMDSAKEWLNPEFEALGEGDVDVSYDPWTKGQIEWGNL